MPNDEDDDERGEGAKTACVAKRWTGRNPIPAGGVGKTIGPFCDATAAPLRLHYKPRVMSGLTLLCSTYHQQSTSDFFSTYSQQAHRLILVLVKRRVDLITTRSDKRSSP